MSYWYVGFTIGSSLHSAYNAQEASKLEREGQDKQAEAGRRQAKAQRRIANIKATRDRTKAVRESRKTIGTAVAQQESSGVSSTGVAGFTGSVLSQTASAVGAGETISAINTETSIFNIEASRQAQALFNKAGGLRDEGNTASAIGSTASIFSKSPRKS